MEGQAPKPPPRPKRKPKARNNLKPKGKRSNFSDPEVVPEKDQ